MTILTPEMRQALEAAGWVFESSRRASKHGKPQDLEHEWEAITGQPIEAQEHNEWFWLPGCTGLAWSVEGLCSVCGEPLEGEEALAYEVCDECA